MPETPVEENVVIPETPTKEEGKDTLTAMVNVVETPVEASPQNAYEEWYHLINTKPAEEANTIQLRGVSFLEEGYKLDETSLDNLKNLAAFLNRYPSLEVEIGGHTSSLGARSKKLEFIQEKSKSDCLLI